MLSLSSTVIETPHRCFSAADVTFLSQIFPQLRDFVKNSSSSIICSPFLGGRWTILIETLLDIKKLSNLDYNKFKTKDDLSFQAIDEKNWWQYFIKRIDKFVINEGNCGTNVLAFVSMPFNPKMVSICDDFYALPRITRIDTLIHEARHFDGASYNHVHCKQGNAQGLTRACDEKLSDNGAYAVQAQVALTLGLNGHHFPQEERAIARSKALNILQNRFNEAPYVKMQQDIYLENKNGMVYLWSLKDNKLLPLKQLSEPSRIYSAGLESIIYPTSEGKTAYRMTEDFTYDVARLGMIAQYYNDNETDSWNHIKAIAYGSTKGGILLHDRIKINCGTGPLVNHSLSNTREKFINIIELPVIQNTVENVLVTENGGIFRIECASQKVTLKKIEITVPKSIKKTIATKEMLYALTDQGEIYSLEKVKNHYFLGSKLAFNQKWIDFSRREVPVVYQEFFDEQN